MSMQWAYLIIMVIIILIASQIFTNALEYFGKKLGVSTGVTGSIFAAIATAMPETMVPMLALIAGTADKKVNQEISVGAILGAPLMLSTLSISLMALSVIKSRGIAGQLSPEKTGLTRDINFFLAAFLLAAVAMYVPLQPGYLRVAISISLIMLYVLYLILTFKNSKRLVLSGHGVDPQKPMYFTRIGMKNNLTTVMLQLLTGLLVLVLGAKGFINGVEHISSVMGVSALLLSLIIIPFATELPEKINSIFWIRNKKDTLAFGNITGAMVFQGTLLPALGILLTPWQPNKIVEYGIFITVAAAVWLRLTASSKHFSIIKLLVNGLLYALYLFLVIS